MCILFLGFSLVVVYLTTRLIPFEKIEQIRAGHYIEITGIKEDGYGDEFDYKLVTTPPETWVSFEEISPLLKGAIIVSEDWVFYEHSGVDFNQLRQAIHEFFETKRLRGASTITQQVVKNLFLDHRQTFTRKLREILIALYFDYTLSKDRILEIYLNIAHWGYQLNEQSERTNFYGIKQAAQYYFETKPQNLDAKQSAFLAMLLPNPNRYSQSFYAQSLSEFARNRIYTIVDLMRIKGYLEREQMVLELKRYFAWEQQRYANDLENQILKVRDEILAFEKDNPSFEFFKDSKPSYYLLEEKNKFGDIKNESEK